MPVASRAPPWHPRRAARCVPRQTSGTAAFVCTAAPTLLDDPRVELCSERLPTCPRPCPRPAPRKVCAAQAWPSERRPRWLSICHTPSRGSFSGGLPGTDTRVHVPPPSWTPGRAEGPEGAAAVRTGARGLAERPRGRCVLTGVGEGCPCAHSRAGDGVQGPDCPEGTAAWPAGHGQAHTAVTVRPRRGRVGLLSEGLSTLLISQETASR